MSHAVERAGGFEPLRHLPKADKTKSGAIEEQSLLLRRIEEAAKFAPFDQLALSPQCGFASVEEGNAITEAEQWDKLALCVDVGREVWAG